MNRFDDVLENFTKTYHLDEGPQTQPFGRSLLHGQPDSQDSINDASLDQLGFPEDGDRYLVEKILDFSRLLFENSANRRLYSSSNHLDSILNTTCISLLNSALRLALRLAQKYSSDRTSQRTSREPIFLPHISHSMLSTHYQIDLDKLQKLCLPFCKYGRRSNSKSSEDAGDDAPSADSASIYATDILSLVQDTRNRQQHIDEYGQPCLTYEADWSSSDPQEPDSVTGSVRDLTPHPPPTGAPTSSQEPSVSKSKNQSHRNVVVVPSDKFLGSPLHENIRDYCSNIPKHKGYEFLCHLRSSWAFCNSQVDRMAMIETRLLAVANYLNIFPEDHHDREIFLIGDLDSRKPELLIQLCDLLQTSRGAFNPVPKWLQALALTVLEAYTNHAKKSAEVNAALGANVNHGVLTYIVRKAVNEMSENDGEPTVEDREWSKSLFGLLHSLPKTNLRVGDGFVAAGILESLVEMLRLRTLKAQICFPQVLTFLDVFICNMRDALTALVNARGLDVLSDLLWYEVEQAASTAKQGKGAMEEWKSRNIDYKVSYIEQTTLRHIFKLIKNMMAMNSGTFDRLLRNLIESSQLLTGLRHVIQRPSIFGSNVWCGAVEIFSNFINNEPTSYPAIAEAGLTEAFLATLIKNPLVDTNSGQSAIGSEPDSNETPPPTIEAISMIPQAFGAICLTETGMHRFVESQAFAAFFSSLLKPNYIKALADAAEDHHRQRRVELENLGASFDELARHFPTLKADIIRNITSMVRALHEGVVSQHTKTSICLSGKTADTVLMAQVQTMNLLSSDAERSDDVEMQDVAHTVTNQRGSDGAELPSSLSRMKAVSEILHGFFNNTSLCSLFIEQGGIEYLIDMLVTPIYPLEWTIQMSQPSFARVIKTFIQQKPHIVLPLLFNRLQEALAICQPFIDEKSHDVFFKAFIKFDQADDSVDGAQTACLSAMVAIRNTLAVLTDSLLESTNRHGLNPLTNVNLADLIIESVPGLTSLQRSCIWECTLIQDVSPSYFNETMFLPTNGQDAGNANNGQASGEATHGSNESEPQSHGPVRTDLIFCEKRNFTRIVQLLRRLPNDVSLYLHSVGKSIMTRRLPSDSFQRGKIFAIAKAIASALTELLQHSLVAGVQEKGTNYYRRSVLLNVLEVLIAKRSDVNSQFLTFIVWQFKKAGGIEPLLDIARHLCLSNDLASSEESLKKPHEASWPVQGLRGILPFLIRATNPRSLNDAIQTQSLNSRSDRERDKPDHFSTGQFLVEMRYYALSFVQQLWDTDVIAKVPRDLVKNACMLIQECLDPQSEQGAYKRTDKVSIRAPSPPRKYTPRYEESLPRLVEKGFEQGLAQESLYRCCDSWSAAEEYCAIRKRNTRIPRCPIPSADLPKTEASMVSESDPASDSPRDVTVTDQSVAANDDADTTSNSRSQEIATHFLDSIIDPDSLGESSRTDVSTRAQFNGTDSTKPETSSETEKFSVSKTAEEASFVTIDSLDALRSTVRETLVDRCLYVLSVFDNLSFELADLITTSINKANDASSVRTDISRTLLHSLISYQGSASTDETHGKIASNAHLLGVVFQDKHFFEAAKEDLVDNVDSLMQYLTVDTNSPSTQSMTWMSNVLLVFEKMLFEDLQPQQIVWNAQDFDKASSDSPSVSLKPPLLSTDSKQSIFKTIMNLAPRVGKDTVLGTSCLRILIALTRSPTFVQELSEKRNIQRLFIMVKQLAFVKNANTIPLLLVTIRQIIEDDSIVRDTMRSEIIAEVEKTSARGGNRLNMLQYTKHVSHLSLRAPEIFVDVTKELLTFPRVEIEGRGLHDLREQSLILKKDQPSVDEVIESEYPPKPKDSVDTAADGDGTAERTVDQEEHGKTVSDPADVNDETKQNDSKVPYLARTDGITSFLLSELLAYKDVPNTEPTSATKDIKPPGNQDDVEMSNNDAPPPQPEASTVPSSSTANESKKLNFKLEDHPIYVYRCLLLQCLTEVLKSYDLAKLNFVGYSRRAESQIPGPVKPHSGVLNYLIQNLIGEFSSIDDNDTASDGKASSICHWAMNVLTSLCARVPDNSLAGNSDPLNEDKDKDADLTFVRRFVLEHALKAYKDAASSTELSRETKLSRLHNYADLFNRMLAGKSNAHPSSHQRGHSRDHVQKKIGKIMLEKHFIPIMTSSVSDMDVKELESHKSLKCILRTIKLLTQVAVDLSTSGNLSHQPEQSEGDEISSATSTSDIIERREETPDLFRNSTLGMFEPGRQDESSSENSDDIPEVVYEEEYADDMEFDEDDPQHGEDDEVVSEEDEAPDGMGPMEGVSGDMPMEVEIELGEDENEDGTDEEESDSEGSSDSSESDDDHEVEIMEELEDQGERSEEEDVDAEDWEDEDEIDFSGDSHLGANINVDDGAPISGAESVSEQDVDVPLPGVDVDVLNDGREPQEFAEDFDAENVHEEDEDQDSDDEDQDMEEEDDYLDEQLGFGRHDFEEEDMHLSTLPWHWEIGSQRARRHHGHHHHHHHHHHGPLFGARVFPDEDQFWMPELHPQRPSGPRTPDETPGTNPLLNRRRALPEQFSHLTAMPHPSRTGPLGSLPAATFFNTLGRHVPDEALGLDQSVLDRVVQTALNSGRALSIAMTGPNSRGEAMADIRQSLHGSMRPSQPNADRETPLNSVAFDPALTTQRWQEAARILFSPDSSTRSTLLVNSLLKALAPPAVERERELRRRREEQHQRIAEEDTKRKAEQQEREAREKQEREEKEAREAEEAEAARVAAESGAAPSENTDDNAEAMEGVESTEVNEQPPEAGPSAPSERVVISIRGREVDITHLGIDLAYLEALPEEMREEVIMQQAAEQRTSNTASGPEASTINSEFLDALPPDIREELLQQEAQERRRQEREQARQRARDEGGPAQPDDIDPASLIASLDPMLRQQVLAESDEDMLAALPPDMAAEARALGGHRRRGAIPTTILSNNRGPSFTVGGRAGTFADGDPQSRGEKPQRRPVVQMLDKAGVAGLLRLMFVPLQKSPGIVNAVLFNICGNRQSRSEVINGLLSILQDGCNDVSAAERCLSQLTVRAKQQAPQKSPQKKATFPTPSSDVLLPTVIEQCVNALACLARAIPHVPHFFVTEHEAIGSVKAKTNRKGKAKDTRASHYPFMPLVGLLERDVVMKNGKILLELSMLLELVTQPLHSIKKPNESGDSDALLDVNEVGGQQNASTNDDSHPAPDTRMESRPATSGQESENQTEGVSRQGSSSVQPNSAAQDDAPLASEESRKSEEKDISKESKKTKVLSAPDVPPEYLKPIVNLVMSKECNSKIFQKAISTMINLSVIEGAKDIFRLELVEQARSLAKGIQGRLANISNALHTVENEVEAQSLALAEFSPAGSDQTKFHRILTALDYLSQSDTANRTIEKERKESKEPDQPNQSTESETASSVVKKDEFMGLYEEESFMSIWTRLGDVLNAVKRPDESYFFNVATILLSLIESLMLVCKRVVLNDGGLSRRPTGQPSHATDMKTIFFSFTNQHKKILNDLVRHNPKLMSNNFSVLIKNPGVLEFDNKRNYFTRRLHRKILNMRHHHHPSLQLHVRRDQVFLDSYKHLHYKSPQEIKYGKLNIRFHNEEGVDAGGVTREWFQVLARQMFNPDYALFNPVASDRTTFHPNNLSWINPEHLRFFKFIGQIIGKALYENRVLDCHFSRAVYKKILGQPVSIKDMETVDLDYSKNMQWMLANDITDIITETFSIVVDKFGDEEIIDLIPDGRHIPVTEENKEEYVRKVIEYRLTGSVQEQLDSFLQGFYDIVPYDLISIFDEGELELLISGMPDVDVDDWKANTDYHTYTASSPQIQWFWRAVRSFDKEERARLLQFVTGTGKVPLNGFKELEGMNGFTRFSIHKDYGNHDRLPSSHTCFNQLDLPEYDNYEQLRKNLYIAMTTGNEHFGFA